MTVEIGCRECGERRRDIKRLLGQAHHNEWAGRPVGPIREQIAALRRELAACDHLETQPLREAANRRATAVAPPQAERQHASQPARTLRDVRTGALTIAPPELKPGQLRCPVCRNRTSLTVYGRLRKHRDLFGHDCHNRAT